MNGPTTFVRSEPTSAMSSLPRRHVLGRLLTLAAGALVPWRVGRAVAAVQSTTPYLGEIMLIPWNFPPKGWAFCNGQLLPINQNQGLFSLLQTTYGGNGQTTFALPDLRGRVAIHQGQGPGLSNYARGDRAGETNHTLVAGEMPAHTHTARGSSSVGSSPNPSPGVVFARNAAQIPQWGTTVNSALAAGAITDAGGSQAHENMQPYLTLHFVICLQGIFPS